MEIIGKIGALVFLVGWVWLIYTAFKESGIIWGIVNIFLQPITGLIYCLVKSKGWLQFLIMLIGAAMMGQILYSFFSNLLANLPR